MDKPISTRDELPTHGQWVLWWNPKYNHWYTGHYWSMSQSLEYRPGFFGALGIEKLEIRDGHTWWLPEPPEPEGEANDSQD